MNCAEKFLRNTKITTNYTEGYGITSSNLKKKNKSDISESLFQDKKRKRALKSSAN